jgi:hypothetical protein
MAALREREPACRKPSGRKSHSHSTKSAGGGATDTRWLGLLMLALMSVFLCVLATMSARPFMAFIFAALASAASLSVSPEEYGQSDDWPF